MKISRKCIQNNPLICTLYAHFTHFVLYAILTRQSYKFICNGNNIPLPFPRVIYHFCGPIFQSNYKLIRILPRIFSFTAAKMYEICASEENTKCMCKRDGFICINICVINYYGMSMPWVCLCLLVKLNYVSNSQFRCHVH